MRTRIHGNRFSKINLTQAREFVRKLFFKNRLTPSSRRHKAIVRYLYPKIRDFIELTKNLMKNERFSNNNSVPSCPWCETFSYRLRRHKVLVRCLYLKIRDFIELTKNLMKNERFSNNNSLLRAFVSLV